MNKKAKIASVLSILLVLSLLSFAVIAKRGGGPAKECRDGIDNDGDGAIDWPADAGCSNKNDNDESNCGDLVCEGGETSSSCAADCGPACGNNQQESPETCDGTDLAGATCQTQGFDAGTLGCQVGCGAYDTSNCFDYVCGNNQQEGSETCDGTDLAGATCQTQGFDGGTLGCQTGCGAYDTSGCYVNTCADSDGGFVITLQGVVNGSNAGSPYFNVDSCVDSVTLKEWSCGGVGNVPVEVNVNCLTNGTGSTTSCVNGACI